MLCLLSVPVFGTAEMPNELSQASCPRTGSPLAAGLQHPMAIRHICRMPQLGYPKFISHCENLYVDGLVWLSLSFSGWTPAVFITMRTVCPFAIPLYISVNFCGEGQACVECH